MALQHAFAASVARLHMVTVCPPAEKPMHSNTPALLSYAPVYCTVSVSLFVYERTLEYRMCTNWSGPFPCIYASAYCVGKGITYEKPCVLCTHTHTHTHTHLHACVCEWCMLHLVRTCHVDVCVSCVRTPKRCRHK